MVAQNVFHKESSHQFTNLWRFADTCKFHGICPPTFIQTWLQQYSRGAFLDSAQCSLNNPICFRSVWCRRALIPGEIFTSVAEFQGIVSVNDFRPPMLLQELVQAPWCVLGSFCFARKRMDPLGGPPRLHIDDCFEIHNLHWELCDPQLSNHQNFLHDVRIHHCVFCTGLLKFYSSDWSRNFGLQGNEYKHCA